MKRTECSAICETPSRSETARVRCDCLEALEKVESWPCIMRKRARSRLLRSTRKARLISRRLNRRATSIGRVHFTDEIRDPMPLRISLHLFAATCRERVISSDGEDVWFGKMMDEITLKWVFFLSNVVVSFLVVFLSLGWVLSTDVAIEIFCGRGKQ